MAASSFGGSIFEWSLWGGSIRPKGASQVGQSAAAYAFNGVGGVDRAGLVAGLYVVADAPSAAETISTDVPSAAMAGRPALIGRIAVALAGRKGDGCGASCRYALMKDWLVVILSLAGRGLENLAG